MECPKCKSSNWVKKARSGSEGDAFMCKLCVEIFVSYHEGSSDSGARLLVDKEK